MPQRPPSFAERLRSALGSDIVKSLAPAPAQPARHSRPYKGSEFADRLRAAIADSNAARH